MSGIVIHRAALVPDSVVGPASSPVYATLKWRWLIAGDGNRYWLEPVDGLAYELYDDTGEWVGTWYTLAEIREWAATLT